MTEFVQALVLGILIGGVYGLMASGLTLIFGVMRIINVAHGAFLILVATLTWWMWQETGIDPILASVLTTPLMFGFGWVVYKLLVSRVRDESPAMSLLLTFGFALVIEGVLNITVGNKYKSASPSYFTESFHIGAISLPKTQVYGFAAAVIVLVVLYVVLTHTWAGRAIRAATQNPSGAALVGVSAMTTSALAFGLGSATAGVGGSILSVLYPFFPASHYDWISRVLGVVVLGGMGSLPGAMTAAFLLGTAEVMTATYGSLQWSTLVFYVVILGVLLFRPLGLFGSRLREDVA